MSDRYRSPILVRELLRQALQDAEDVIRTDYPGAITDRLFLAAIAQIAADIRVRLGEARVLNAVANPTRQEPS